MIIIVIILSVIISFALSYFILRKESLKRCEILKTQESYLISEIQKLNEEKDLIIKSNYDLRVTEQNKTAQRIKELTEELAQEVAEKRIAATQQMYAAYLSYSETIDNSYLEIEKEFDKSILELELDKQKAEKELLGIKSKLSAGIEACLREQEKKDNAKFYMINIAEDDLSDIDKLDKMKYFIKNKDIIAKLIWNTYIQKPTNDLCNRVIGTSTKTGIYKITNTTNGKVYIGQSVDITTRLKTHIKAGLGIDASSTSRLYNEMQKYGVWNFTFELLEECKKDELNEKEKFWISMYRSNEFGLNSTKGNK